MLGYIFCFHPLFDILTDFGDETDISEICEVKIWNSGLPDSVDLTWSAKLEIDLREFKTISRRLHGTQTISFILLGREEITVTLMFSASDAPAELMELREPKSL